MKQVLSKAVLQANIEYHSKMGLKYQEQPHINKKNAERIQVILKDIQKETKGKKLLDVGCGTGFIVDIAKNIFDEVIGLDITPAMLEQIKPAKNVKTILAESSKMPFENNLFDSVTSCSFLHHLYRIQPTLREIYRVLKKGGIYFNDLDPNFYYFHQLSLIDPNSKYGEIIGKELEADQKLYTHHKAEFQIEKRTIDLAEYHRQIKRGMKEEDITRALKSVGFKEIKIFYYWFLGQGEIEKMSIREAQDFDLFFQKLLPISRDLYKYFGFYAKK